MDRPINTEKTPNRLAIGTAQFGLHYGVSNTDGQVTLSNVKDILRLARAHELNTLDTAKLYGSSEHALGQTNLEDFNIITKLPPVPEDTPSVSDWILKQVHHSIEILGTKTLHGVLLHRPSQLQTPIGREIIRALLSLKETGVIRKLGVSVYDPSELDYLISKFDIDLVQTPFNILDRRILESGWLDRLADSGIEVHTRSAFLQGLMLMQDDERPDYFATWAPLFQAWSHWLTEYELTPLEACIRYVLSHSQISKVVVGVESPSQLLEIIRIQPGDLPYLPDSFASPDLNLINPSLWKLP